LSLSVSHRYRENARAQICAARDLTSCPDDIALGYLGPTLLLLGFAVEVFLKAHHIDKGMSVEAARKTFGHDLMKLWNHPSCADLRAQSVQIILMAHHDLEMSFEEPQSIDPRDERYQPGLIRTVPPVSSFGKDLERLSRLHGTEEAFALRYPLQKIEVPDPMLMIKVFEYMIK